ncbi:UNVERIFIED_CONTAM: hypothetical protein FKN15_073603 [Acipenser sinensis]
MGLEKDENDVQKLMETTNEIFQNPFNLKSSESSGLFNIATGIVLPDTLAKHLVHAQNIGRTAMLQFVDKRLNNNIAPDHNLFSRLIVVARNRDIDLKQVLRYELAAVKNIILMPLHMAMV